MSSCLKKTDLIQTIRIELNHQNAPGVVVNKNIAYPTYIVYTSCRHIENLPRVSPHSDRLIVGATWLEWSYLDLFDVRRALFERSLWPYTMPECSRWATHRGILLRSRLNLTALTDMSNPQIVYLTEKKVIFAKMIFHPHTVHFIEIIHVTRARSIQ